jgi:hypothetical protein
MLLVQGRIALIHGQGGSKRCGGGRKVPSLCRSHGLL